MSVMSTLVNHKSKKMLTLGKQWWGQWLDFKQGSGRLLLLDRSFLMEVIAMTLRHSEAKVSYALYLRDLIHDFILDAGLDQLEVLTDSNDGARLWELEHKEGYTDKLCTHFTSEEIEKHMLENY